jgi:hypothetical protein
MTLVVTAMLLDAGRFLVALWGDALDHCQAA